MSEYEPVPLTVAPAWPAPVISTTSQQFGITAAITIAYSQIVSVLVVPPAMTVWGAYQNMRLRGMIQRQWDELDVAIEEIHRRHSEE